MTVQSQSKTRRHSTCHRHPATRVTGFCASCLRERLAGIEAPAAASAGNKSPSRELRRSKSCSGGPKSEEFPANPGAAGDDSRRRKSCDVRPRGSGGESSSLCALFNRDDERKGTPRKLEAELGNLGFDPKGEEKGEAEGNGEARADEETKTMKELIDLEWTRKRSGGGGTGRDFRDMAGTFWEKASGLSKKLMKWRRKAKSKKEEENDGVSRRETQSEVGEYGLGGGRRSCDADPRRMSVEECRRLSFEEPRASWDACWIGRSRMVPPMVADGGGGGFETTSPGGTAQTRDYYCRGRRSFECPNPDDLGLVPNANANAKVSPATTELFYGAKLLIASADPAAATKKPPQQQGWGGRVWSIWGGVGGSKKEGPVSEKLIRSYSVSQPKPGTGPGWALKSREELALPRNRSARYSPSPSNVESGLLRFYLTPLRSHHHHHGNRKSSRKHSLTMMPKNVL